MADPLDSAMRFLKGITPPPEIPPPPSPGTAAADTYNRMRQLLWQRSVQNQLNPDLPPQRGEEE
jgi:hypothetical protein